MPALYIVAARQVTETAVSKTHIKLRRLIDGAPRALEHKTLHALYLTAVVAHNINRVRMQCFDLKPRTGLPRVHDPHAHVHEEQVADVSVVHPLLGQARSGGKAVVHIYSVTQSLFPCQSNHLLGWANFV